jgi:stress-induced morphogen
MIVTTIKRTTIEISAKEIRNLVQRHLEENGYAIEQIQYNIKAETFTGMTIIANVTREDNEID